MKLKLNGILHVIKENINGEWYFRGTANNLEEAQERVKHFTEVEKKFNGKSLYGIEIYYNQKKINEIFIDTIKKT